jgi:predicted  nucleic acid-binding Zn-ribbon protein
LTARARIEKLLEATRARQRTPDEDRRRLERVEQRLEHLETMVEGLQDAIHRDSIRHEERMSELERKTEPEAVAKALSEDARRRGL